MFFIFPLKNSLIQEKGEETSTLAAEKGALIIHRKAMVTPTSLTLFYVHTNKTKQLCSLRDLHKPPTTYQQ